MESVIDNLEDLRKLDKGRMLKALREFPEYCRQAVEIVNTTPLGDLVDMAFEAVVFIGMGGSAIGGQLVGDWLSRESTVPIVVSRGYNLPGFVNEETLVFAVSYSGNTEETLSAFQEALERRASIVSVTSGGLLEGLSKRLSLIHI